jgi:hypothetical protein
MTDQERSTFDDVEQRRAAEEPGIDYATETTVFEDPAFGDAGEALASEADPADVLEQWRDDGPPDEDERPETD